MILCFHNTRKGSTDLAQNLSSTTLHRNIIKEMYDLIVIAAASTQNRFSPFNKVFKNCELQWPKTKLRKKNKIQSLKTKLPDF